MSEKNIRSIFTHCYLRDLLVIRLCRYEKDNGKPREKRTQIIHKSYIMIIRVKILYVY